MLVVLEGFVIGNRNLMTWVIFCVIFGVFGGKRKILEVDSKVGKYLKWKILIKVESYNYVVVGLVIR